MRKLLFKITQICIIYGDLTTVWQYNDLLGSLVQPNHSNKCSVHCADCIDLRCDIRIPPSNLGRTDSLHSLMWMQQKNISLTQKYITENFSLGKNKTTKRFQRKNITYITSRSHFPWCTRTPAVDRITWWASVAVTVLTTIRPKPARLTI